MNGESPAWHADYSKFYLESVPRLVAFLSCNGLSAADAADCVQETLIAALPPVWDTIESPYAWCRTVAHRKAMALWRRRRETPVAEHPETGTSALVVHAGIEQVECGMQLAHWMSQLVSVKQRQVLAWTYDGATAAEIAAALHMSPATVRSTLRNGRTKLHKLRAEDGDNA